MRVLIAVPTRGFIHHSTVTRLQEIRDATPGLDPIFYQEGHLNVALTRNFVVREFMKGPWDVLVMVDDDVVPPPNLMACIQHLTKGWDIVGIPYLMLHEKMFEFAVFNRPDPDKGYFFLDLQEGINECAAIGTGCIAIHRRVFDKLGDRPFRMGSDPDDFVTDDMLFCEDSRAAGFKIGYVWEKWFADHCTTVSLAILKSIMVREKHADDSSE